MRGAILKGIPEFTSKEPVRVMPISCSGHSVDPLPEDVRVAVVAGVLLDHVHVHPAKTDLEPVHGPAVDDPSHLVERPAGTLLPPPGDLPPPHLERLGEPTPGRE